MDESSLKERLKLSNDRKVSPYSVLEANGRHKPLVPNSFGLLSGPEGSCPDATEFCTSCYAANLERLFPSAGRLVTHNLELLKACGSNVSKIVELLEALMEDYRKAHAKAEKRIGKTIEKMFRIHWDGDFYSKPYTSAWAIVIRSNPDIQFWVYTRSYGFVDALEGLDNLTLYLSVDEYNMEKAILVTVKHPWVKLAFCATTWEESEALARKVSGRNAPRCPELTKKTPLVNNQGVGACIACMLCIRGVNNVRFAVKR